MKFIFECLCIEFKNAYGTDQSFSWIHISIDYFRYNVSYVRIHLNVTFRSISIFDQQSTTNDNNGKIDSVNSNIPSRMMIHWKIKMIQQIMLNYLVHINRSMVNIKKKCLKISHEPSELGFLYCAADI